MIQTNMIKLCLTYWQFLNRVSEIFLQKRIVTHCLLRLAQKTMLRRNVTDAIPPFFIFHRPVYRFSHDTKEAGYQMEKLSPELLHNICFYAGLEACLTLSRVSTTLSKRITQDSYLWRKFAKQRGNICNTILTRDKLFSMVAKQIMQRLKIGGTWRSVRKTVWASKRLQ